MNIIPFHLRKQITEGMFSSVLAYCLPVFGGCDKFEIEALQVMQNRAARLVTHSQSRTSRKVNLQPGRLDDSQPAGV